MKLTDVIRAIPGGAAKSGLAVDLKKHSDASTITTLHADSNGLVTYQANGNPYGPVYLEYTDTSGSTTYTRRSSSKACGIADGLSLAEIPAVLAALGDGIVNTGNKLALTNSSLQLNVNTGVAVLQGYPYVGYTAQTNVALSGAGAVTAPAGNPRKDVICLHLRLPGTSDEGTFDFYRVAGTPAASPTKPAVPSNTSTDAYVEIASYQISTGGTISAITAPSPILTTLTARNPTVFLRKDTAGTVNSATSTTPAAITGLSWSQADVSLVGGVTYDVLVECFLPLSSTAGATTANAQLSLTTVAGGTVTGTLCSSSQSDYLSLMSVASGVVVGGESFSGLVNFWRSGNNNTIRNRDCLVSVTFTARS